MALDYDSEYATLIVNHNLSYETVALDEGGKGIVIQQQPNKKTVTPNHSRDFSKDGYMLRWPGRFCLCDTQLTVDPIAL